MMLAALLAGAPGLPSPKADTKASLLQPEAAVNAWGHRHRPHGHNPHRHSPHTHAPFSCNSHPQYAQNNLETLKTAISIMGSAYALEEREKARVGYGKATMASKLSGRKEYAELLNIPHENRTAQHHADIEMGAALFGSGTFGESAVADDAAASSNFAQKLVTSGPGEGGYAYCGTYGGKKVLVFCGSSDGSDWEHNFASAFTKTTGLGGARTVTAGAGFIDQYDNIMSGAVRTCATSGTNEIQVYGHSLGGALSELGAAEMVARGMKVELFNAGGARAMQGGDADWMQARVYQSTTPAYGYPPSGGYVRVHRMANYNDPVPCVPFNGGMGFKHFGNLNYVNDPCIGACGMKVQIWDQDNNPAISLTGAFSSLLIDVGHLIKTGGIQATPNHMLWSVNSRGYYPRLTTAQTSGSSSWIAQGAGCAANGVYDVVAGAASGVVSGVAGGVSGVAGGISGGVSGIAGAIFGEEELRANQTMPAQMA